MNKYTVEIVFENGTLKHVKGATAIMIKINDQYLKKSIDDIIHEPNRYKPYTIYAEDQRFDFIKYKDAIFIHYTLEG